MLEKLKEWIDKRKGMKHDWRLFVLSLVVVTVTHFLIGWP